jgi:hypothetical protein
MEKDKENRGDIKEIYLAGAVSGERRSISL